MAKNTIQGSSGNVLDVDANGALKAALTGSLGVKPIIVNQSYEIAPETWEPILDLDEPFILDHLEWTAMHETITWPSLRFKDGDGGNILSVLKLDGTGTAGPSAKNINENFPGYIDVLRYDTGANLYRFQYNKEFVFPQGIVFQMRNNSPTNTHNIGVQIVGRILR